MNFVRRNKTLSALLAASGLGVLAWLAFGFFGIQAAFIDNVVDEDGPVFAVAAPAVEQATAVATTAPVPVQPLVQAGSSDTADPDQPADSTAPAVEPAPDVSAPEGAELAPTAEPVPVEVDAAEPVTDVESAPQVDPPQQAVPTAVVEAEVEPESQAAAPQSTPVPAPTPTAVPTAVPAPIPEPTPAPQPATPGEVVTTFRGQFRSLNGYSVVGDATVLSNGTDQRFLRFENFASDNGPDLKVYLRAANGDFVSLGDLSGNIGNQNYEIPVGVDLNVFNSVEIWCQRFSSGFGAAALSAS